MSNHKQYITILLTGLCLFIMGCQKSPQKSDAEAWFKQNKSALKTLESTIAKHVGALPGGFGAFKCRRPMPNQRIKLPSCSEQLVIWKKKYPTSKDTDLITQTFNNQIKSLMNGALVGLKIKVSKNALNNKATKIWRFGVFPANKKGAVSPEKGLKIDDHQIGWGLGQAICAKGSAKPHGESKYHTQFDVLWSFKHNNHAFDVRASYMPKTQPTVAWRQHCIK